jgi:membrane-anchored glycerophosphoryl diester phosphodiesterase (GDPDase)
LAFDELGPDQSQLNTQKYTLSATGVVSRTLGLWKRRFVQYIIIVGIIGACTVTGSFIVLFALFGTIGIIGTDPVTYLVSILAFTTLPDLTLIGVTLLFASVVFVVNAILGGAAIKFTLDDYNARNGDIQTSLSHSYGKALNFIAVQLVISFLTAIFLYPGLNLLLNAMTSIDITDPYNPIFPPDAIQMMMVGSTLLMVGVLVMVYISARLAPARAIVIDTNLSAIASLKKSWVLTSGNVMHVIGSWFIFGIAINVLGFLVSAFTYLLGYVGLYSYSLVIESIIGALLFWALNYIFPVVLYRDLSSRVKESSLDELMI